MAIKCRIRSFFQISNMPYKCVIYCMYILVVALRPVFDIRSPVHVPRCLVLKKNCLNEFVDGDGDKEEIGTGLRTVDLTAA